MEEKELKYYKQSDLKKHNDFPSYRDKRHEAAQKEGISGDSVVNNFLPCKKLAKCRFCNDKFKEDVIHSHLVSELKKQKQQKGKDEKDSKKKAVYYLIKIGANSMYLWLLVNVNEKIYEIDRKLRAIWLECCGHLSQFGVDDFYYCNSEMNDEDQFKTMNFSIGEIFKLGHIFSYEYDFGSTTNLSGRIMQVIAFPRELECMKTTKCLVLARNIMTHHKCDDCKDKSDKKSSKNIPNAEKFCEECGERRFHYMCSDCADEHECEEYFVHTIANSPRAGICGYEPSDEDESDFFCDDRTGSYYDGVLYDA